METQSAALATSTGPTYRAPLSALELLATAPIAWSTIKETHSGRFTLSVTHRAEEGCLLTSDVKVVEVDAHEWAIESVDGPELSDDAAAELCGDLARWSLTFSSHFRDIAAYLEPTKAVA